MAGPSPNYGEEVGAFVILKDGACLTERRCATSAGTDRPFKIPKYVFFVDQFPYDGQRQDPEVQVEGHGSCPLEGSVIGGVFFCRPLPGPSGDGRIPKKEQGR